MTPRTLRRKLAKDFPIRRRVVVISEATDDGSMGECWMEGDSILINLAPAVQDEQAHTLAHEWAHAIIFDRNGKLSTRHTVEWAREFAKIYQTYWD